MPVAAFANLALKSSYVMGFGTAILYTMKLVGLDNIQEKLEHPFDQDSIDDIHLDYTAAYERTLQGPERGRAQSSDCPVRRIGRLATVGVG